MKVAVIPARGGSKRIPRKNIRSFHGRPMIAWAIDAAKISEEFDRIIVSTDDPEIAEISQKYGAEVPFIRPVEISGDLAGTDAVLVHALDWLEENSEAPIYVCCIYPCVPFLTGPDISDMFLKTKQKGFATSMTVTHFPHPIWRSLIIDHSGRCVYRWPEHRCTRSQDLPEMFHDAGQCYWLNVESYRRDPRLVGERTLPYIIPRWKAQDIDNEWDWELAERLYAATKPVDGK